MLTRVVSEPFDILQMGRADPTPESHRRCGTESVSGTHTRASGRPMEVRVRQWNPVHKTLISQLSEDDQSSWDSMLPEISLDINSSISD